MPQIQVRGPDGTYFSIHSSDPEIIGKWMLEQIRKMVTQNASYGMWSIGPVYPLMVWNPVTETYVPDWPVAGQGEQWQLNEDQMAELASAIRTILSHKTVGYSRFGPIRLGTPIDPRETETRVSEARWCDYRDHPYKGGREGTIMMGQTVKMANGGQAATQDVREICPECAAELGLNPDYEAPEPPAVRRELLGKSASKSK